MKRFSPIVIFSAAVAMAVSLTSLSASEPREDLCIGINVIGGPGEGGGDPGCTLDPFDPPPLNLPEVVNPGNPSHYGAAGGTFRIISQRSSNRYTPPTAPFPTQPHVTNGEPILIPIPYTASGPVRIIVSCETSRGFLEVATQDPPVYRYTPGPGSYVDAFSYVVKDDSATAQSWQYIHVRNPQPPYPSVDIRTFQTTFRTPADVTPTGNGNPMVVASDPMHGNLSGPVNNLVYTPRQAMFGTDFDVVFSELANGRNGAANIIQVAPPNTTVRFYIDNQLIDTQRGYGPKDFQIPAGLSSGFHSVLVRTDDDGGGGGSTSGGFFTDATPPLLSWWPPAPVQDECRNDWIVLKASSTDPPPPDQPSGVDYVEFRPPLPAQPVRVQASEPGPFEYQFDSRILNDGLQSFSAVSVDVAGNISTTTLQVSLRINNRPPNLQVSLPSGATVYQDTTITVTGINPIGCGISSTSLRYPINGTGGTNVVSVLSNQLIHLLQIANLPDGRYNLTATTVDRFQHESTLVIPFYVARPPVARVAIETPLPVLSGRPVQLRDVSLGNITAREWRTPDGGVLAGPLTNPTFAADLPNGMNSRSYQVTLRVRDSRDIWSLNTATVTVLVVRDNGGGNPDRPIAVATTSTPEPAVNSTALMVGTQSTGAFLPLSYNWRQISGPVFVQIEGAATANASFVPPQTGVYVMELTVADTRGVPSLPAVLVFHAGSSGQRPLMRLQGPSPIRVNEQAGYDASQSERVQQFLWEIAHAEQPGQVSFVGPVDRSTATLRSAVAQRVLIKVKGTNAFGFEEAYKAVDVRADVPPIAVAEVISTQPVVMEQPGRLRGSRSVGDIDRYEWTALDPHVTLNDRFIADPTFTATLDAGVNAASYPIALRVRNRSGVWSINGATVSVLVVRGDGGDTSRPIAIATTTTPAPLVGSQALMDGSLSQTNFPPLLYNWRQIDGPPVHIVNPNQALAHFVPPIPGTYVMELVVADQRGVPSLPAILAFQAGASNDRPRVGLNGPSVIRVNELVRYDTTGSLGVQTYSWEIVRADQPNLVSFFGPTDQPAAELRSTVAQVVIIKVRGTNASGFDDAYKAIDVRADVPPIAVAELLTPQPMPMGQEGDLRGSNSIGDIGLYEWTALSPNVTLSNRFVANPTFSATLNNGVNVASYQIQLRVRNQNQIWSLEPSTVTVLIVRPNGDAPNDRPVAIATTTTPTPAVNETALMDGSLSQGTYLPLAFNWRQISGPPVNIQDASRANASFAPTREGIYAMELVVVDTRPVSSLPAVLVFRVGTPSGQPPQMVIQGDNPIRTAEEAIYDASASIGAQTYSWHIVHAEQPAQVQFIGPTDQPTVTLRSIAPQAVLIKVRGTNQFGFDEAYKAIDVRADLPPIALADLLTPQPLHINQWGQISGLRSIGDIAQWEWSAADPRVEIENTNQAETRVRVTSLPDGVNAASFDVTLRVRNQNQVWSVDPAVLSVLIVRDSGGENPNRPVAVATATPTEPPVGTPVFLDGTGSYGGQPPLLFNWRQIAGPPVQIFGADQNFAFFVPTRAGLHLMELIVVDQRGIASLPAFLQIHVGGRGGRPDVVMDGEPQIRVRQAALYDATRSQRVENFGWQIVRAQQPAEIRFVGPTNLATARLESFVPQAVVIKVRGSNSFGFDEAYKAIDIRADIPPIAVAYVETPQPVVSGALVQLRDRSIGDIAVREWRALDGGTVTPTQDSAQFQVTLPPNVPSQSYRVTLRVQNTQNVWSLNTSTVTILVIRNNPGATERPTAVAATTTPEPDVGSVALMDASLSTGTYGPLSYNWRQLMGSPVQINGAGTVNASFVPTERGIYVMELVVVDTQPVSSLPAILVFHAGGRNGAPRMRINGLSEIRIDQEAVYDTQGSVGVETYRWDIIRANQPTRVRFNGPIDESSARLISEVAQPVLIRVRGTNSFGFDEAYKAIDVRANLPPVAVAELLTPQPMVMNQLGNLQGINSIGAFSYEWQAMSPHVTLSNPTGPNPTFSATLAQGVDAASYHIVLRVRNRNNLLSLNTSTVTVVVIRQNDGGAPDRPVAIATTTTPEPPLNTDAILDGRPSFGDYPPLIFNWRQFLGAPVQIIDADQPVAHFKAAHEGMVGVELVVADQRGISSLPATLVFHVGGRGGRPSMKISGPRYIRVNTARPYSAEGSIGATGYSWSIFRAEQLPQVRFIGATDRITSTLESLSVQRFMIRVRGTNAVGFDEAYLSIEAGTSEGPGPLDPTIRILTPPNNALVRDVVDIGVEINNVRRLEYFVDGTTRIGVVQVDPGVFSSTFSWNSRPNTQYGVPDGVHSLKSVGYSITGTSASHQIQLTVDNTTPTVQIVSPTNGQILFGRKPLVVTAADLNGINRVEGLIGNVRFRFDRLQNSNTFQHQLDTTQFPDGGYELNVLAADNAGNIGRDSRQFQINNTNPPPSRSTLVFRPAHNAFVVNDEEISVTVEPNGSLDLASVVADTIRLSIIQDGRRLTWPCRARYMSGRVVAELDSPLPHNVVVEVSFRAKDTEGNLIEGTARYTYAMRRRIGGRAQDSRGLVAITLPVNSLRTDLFMEVNEVPPGQRPPFINEADSELRAGGAGDIELASVKVAGRDAQQNEVVELDQPAIIEYRTPAGQDDPTRLGRFLVVYTHRQVGGRNYWERLNTHNVPAAIAGDPPGVQTIRVAVNRLGHFLVTAAVVPQAGVTEVINYPNPASPAEGCTTFQYQLSNDSEVTVVIYDIFGNLVRKVTLPPGIEGGRRGQNTYTWDCRNGEGDVVANGGYITNIMAKDIEGNTFKATRKVGVVK